MDTTMRPTALSEGIEEDTINTFVLRKLPNELLIRILEYLGYGDLREMRLVCKQWHALIQLSKFVQKSILIINPYNIATLYDMIQQNNEFVRSLAYDNVALHDVEVCDKLQLIVKFLGPRIHKLRLHKTPLVGIPNDCLPELEELTLRHVRLIRNDILGSIDSNKFDLNKLKSLDVDCFYEFHEINNHEILNQNREVKLEIQKLCINVSLRSQTFLIHILQFQSQSLKHLEINFGRGSPQHELEWTQTFALLEHLEVLKLNGTFSKEWLQEIMQALPIKAPLRYFCFDTVTLFDYNKVFTTKWPTLLTNIRLVCIAPEFDEDIQVSAHLWHSVRRLSFQTEYNMFYEVYIKFVSEPPFDINKMNEIVQSFNRITHLSIEIQVANANDSTLSLIFRHLLQLRHLHINQCANMTDQGLLGYGAHPAPITNLKCLQSLRLRYYIDMTDLPLVKCFKFIELRKLELTFSNNISSKGIKEMVKNCPALEDLILSGSSALDDDCILHIAQGLPRLRQLDVSKCTRLTNKSLQYIVNYCKSLKELIARDINMNAKEEWEQILKKKMYYYV